MNILRHLINRFEVESREKLNPMFASRRREKIISGRENFTIISNTCWAGHVYRYFGLPYLTPTIGVGFYADDYMKFVTNLREYLSMDIEMISVKDSVHYEDIIANHHPRFHNCPYARLGDIELRFAHYKTPEDAMNHWNKRKQRVNYDNLIIKFSEHQGCTEEHLRAFDALPYERKFVFTTKDYGLESQVISTEYAKLGDVKDDTLHFKRYIDLVKLVNGESFKK